MREIVLKHFSKEVVGFPTFWEAIRSNLNSPRSIRARATSEQIVGRTVGAGCWEDHQAAFLFSGGCALHLFVVEHDVEWQLTSGTRFDEFRQSWTSDSEPVNLSRRCNDGRLLTTMMDRAAMMARLVDRKADASRPMSSESRFSFKTTPDFCGFMRKWRLIQNGPSWNGS